MAELQTSEARTKRGMTRRKKLSTRVDLTPMVDLGFLLITFFIFTTTMSQARAMNLVMPDERKADNPTTTAESKTISLILGANNLIYYYNGLDIKRVLKTGYSATGIRMVLQNKAKQLSALGQPGEMVVLIKPTTGSSYKNLIDIMDEMLINDVKKYVMVEVSKEEVAVAE